MRDDPRWFSLLCCPACGGELELRAATEIASDGHIMSGKIGCQHCETIFSIVRGVPRFAALAVEENVDRTVDSFGYQWQRGNTVAVDDKFSSADLFLDFIAPVRPEYFKDKSVLDAGCGQARFAKNAQAFGAKLVVGVDLSESVNVAFENTRTLSNVLIVQARFAQPAVEAGI